MTFAHFIVVKVMSRGDFDAAGAEVFINIGVGNNRNQTAGNGTGEPADPLNAGNVHRPGERRRRCRPTLVSGRVVATTKWPLPSAKG